MAHHALFSANYGRALHRLVAGVMRNALAAPTPV
jgi:hypothetical protein